MDPFDAQMRIMQQSNALQETVQDLYRWEKEMKRKENLSHQSVAASEVSFTTFGNLYSAILRLLSFIVYFFASAIRQRISNKKSSDTGSNGYNIGTKYITKCVGESLTIDKIASIHTGKGK